MGKLIGAGYLVRGIVVSAFLLNSYLFIHISDAKLAIVLSIILYVVYLMLMYIAGAKVGRNQYATTKIVRKKRKQGLTPTQKELNNRFRPKKCIVAGLIVAAPWILVASVNLIYESLLNGDQETIITAYTRLHFLPEMFLTRLCTELVSTETSGAVNAAVASIKAISKGTLDTGAFIANTAVMDGVYSRITNDISLKLLNVAYVIWPLIPPYFMFIGYMRGRKLKKKKAKLR